MRPIDADRLMEIIRPMCGEFTDNGFMIDYQRVMSMIDSAPTIDAVEVVRCKECMFGKVYQNDSSGVESIWCKAFTTPRMVTDDDFCSYGEREGE